MRQIAADIYVFAVTKWAVKGIQEQEKLHYKVADYSNSAYLTNDEDAERLIITAAILGEDWPEGGNIVDLTKVGEMPRKALISPMANMKTLCNR